MQAQDTRIVDRRAALAVRKAPQLITRAPVLAGTTPWELVMEAFLGAAVDSPLTARAYRRRIREAFLAMGVDSLADLTGGDLAQYRARLLAMPGRGPATHSQALFALRSFLRWSKILGAHRLDTDVVEAALKPPKSTVERPYRVLNDEDVDRLWRESRPASKERAMLAVCLGAGLRVSELAKLCIRDCLEDLEGGPALHIRQAKGAKDRVIPVRPETYSAIEGYVVASGRSMSGSGRLFLAEDRAAASRGGSGGISTTGCYLDMRTLFRRAGVRFEGVAIHGLRHGYAMGVLRHSKNVVLVSKLLGHSSLATTQRYVNHINLDELRDALPPARFGGES